ncbi:hypothetical protein NDU88_002758 [Pleurodeles waltl]|uniref:Uncharacterized protein n=1 Tax=Pleurodeles waltl TaxID=8319 RepID=A0AAV7PA98_PLEWA|nr:hypothetical protein NDU88_002758 [Pleurodeles waltl]
MPVLPAAYSDEKQQSTSLVTPRVTPSIAALSGGVGTWGSAHLCFGVQWVQPPDAGSRPVWCPLRYLSQSELRGHLQAQIPHLTVSDRTSLCPDPACQLDSSCRPLGPQLITWLRPCSTLGHAVRASRIERNILSSSQSP